MQYDDVITNPRWRTDAILKIIFWLYLSSILTDQREIWNGDEGSLADIGHMTKNCNFRKFKMADGRHIENRFWLYLRAILADQSEIWNRDERSHAHIGRATKTAFFSNSRCRTDPILKIVFWLYLGAILADLCKFRNGDEELHADIGQWQFSQIQDGGRPPFSK